MFRKEPGNIIDQLAGVLTMCFMFAALLAYICFGRMVQIRLDIDNIAKKYLYQMEQYGYLKDQDKDKLIENLKNIPEVSKTGREPEILPNTNTSTNVADYGELVTLDFKVYVHNPLHDHFNTPGWFYVDGINETEEYHVNISSTAKQ